MLFRGFNFSSRAITTPFKLIVTKKPSYINLSFLYYKKFSSSHEKTNNYQKIEVAQDDLFKSKLPEEFIELQQSLDHANEAFNGLEYEKALKSYKQILNIISQHQEQETEAKANIYLRIGQCLLFINRPAESADYFVASLKIILQLFGKNHIRTAQILALMGNLNFMCNRLEQAFSNFEESRKIYMTLSNIQPSELASILRLMGNVHERLQHYFKALDLYQEAIYYFEQEQTKNILQVYETRKDTAKIFLKLSKFEEAYQQYSNCINLANQYLERDPLALSDLEERCGELSIKTNQHLRAAQHFENASKLTAEKVGDTHMKVTELSLKAANLRQEASSSS